jgi:hypothetical protein
MNGKSLESHAPGVERFLISLDKVASFVDLHVSPPRSRATRRTPTTGPSPSVDGQIGPEVLTGRYDDGLPEELR